MDEQAIWKALADETRRQILHLLLMKDFCVRGLARHLGISEAAVSQHIKVLKQAGLVHGEKRGYFVHYHVERQVIADFGQRLIDLVSV